MGAFVEKFLVRLARLDRGLSEGEESYILVDERPETSCVSTMLRTICNAAGSFQHIGTLSHNGDRGSVRFSGRQFT